MDYDSCYTPQCPKREACTLWHNALQRLQEGATQLNITNPKLIEEAGGYEYCPLHQEHKLRSFARALVWTYREMTLDQLERVHAALISHFGYSKVVRMRCGYEAISPEEQATIAGIFEAVAPGSKPQYKGFEEHYTKPRRVEGKAAHKLLK